MNIINRIKMVKAMEYIARYVNNEEIFYDLWLESDGVSDGDVARGDLAVNEEDLEQLNYYTESENFAALMGSFLSLMKEAYEDGGIWCDGILSVSDSGAEGEE